jgi:fructose-1-phosphate kinase PfkB-like protein
VILTVTPNPAWDLTYEVPALVPGEVHRVARVHRRLGGKGVNVARVLHAAGHDVVAVMPGSPGLAAAAGLDVPAGQSAAAVGSRLVFDVVPGLAGVRQTIVIQGAEGTTTSFWEPGIEPDPGTDRALIGRVRAWLHPGGRAGEAADVQGAGAAPRPAARVRGIAIAGSLPPGFDARFPARLATMALEAGVPAVVDTSGEALKHAASAPGAVLKPNAAELAQLTGRPCQGPAEAIDAARTLLEGPPLAVVVTLGKDGLAVVTRNGVWRGCVTERLAGNPTGAGDAAAAALIAGLVAAATWPEIVREAVALSAGAVLSPVAGEVAPADIARLRSQAVVTEVA